MSGKVIEFMKQQKYRFDFGTDDKLYVAIFNARIPQAELKGLVSSLQGCLYGKVPHAVYSYMRLRRLEFSDFNSIEIPLQKDRAFRWAGGLLHSSSHGKMDEILGDTDVFFSVMDCQGGTPEGDCEGCRFAAGRLPRECGGYRHHAIAQTFSSGMHGLKEHGCFAIRQSDGSGNFLDIFREEGGPVLPVYGCVDMAALLPGIESFRTKEAVLEAAIK